MRHLFTFEGEAALAAVMAQRPLLAFDFDGTLAPIVARPEEARVSLAITRRLESLAKSLPLAIISGRAVEDVRARLSFEPDFIIGNHGAEDPTLPVPPERTMLFDAVRQRLELHAGELEAAEVSVEDKGQSMALHYRLARDRPRALAVIERLLANLGSGIRAYGGKMVVNVVDAQAPDKAEAVFSLLQRCGVQSALFAGDDLNDEPVFARAEPSWLTVKVGRDYPNTQAMFCLDNFGEVASMLDRMLTLARSL